MSARDLKDEADECELVNHLSLPRVALVGIASLLAMIGFDFFLHAGLLATLYLQPAPFLLPPAEAFRRIPLGYLSFSILTVLLLWLMVRLKVTGWRRGAEFGLKLGALVWGALALGLWSISTAEAALLAGWFAGQTVELAIGGAVAGAGLGGQRLRTIFLRVIAFVLLLVVITIGMQSAGLAPAARL